MSFTRLSPIQLTRSGRALRALCLTSLPLSTLVYQPGVQLSIAVLWLLWAIMHLEAKRNLAQLSQLSSEWEHLGARLTCARGDQLEVILALTNPHRFALSELELRLRAQEGLSAPLLLSLAPGARLKIPVCLEGRRLGEAKLWGVELIWTGPLHLTRAHILRSLPLRYLVTPNRGHGQLLYRQAETARGDGRNRHARTQEGDFQELRAYQMGDELKRVAWRSSARRGELMSKVYEEPRQRRLLIAVDVGPLMRELNPSGQRAITSAIEIAYAELHRARNFEVGLILFDHRLIGALAPSGRPLNHYTQLLQYASQVYESDCVELDQQHLIALLGEHLYFSGIDSARLGGFEHVRSGARELILANEYWSEAIEQHTGSAVVHTHSYPLGLSSHHWRTRHLSACLTLGLHVPYRQSSRYGDSAKGLQALVSQAQRWGVTELLILSNAERLESPNDLYPLRAWAKRGGQLTWCDLSSASSSHHPLPALPHLYDPQALLSTLRGYGKVLRVPSLSEGPREALNAPPATFGVAQPRP